MVRFCYHYLPTRHWISDLFCPGLKLSFAQTFRSQNSPLRRVLSARPFCEFRAWSSSKDQQKQLKYIFSIIFLLVEWKVAVRDDFFENKLLLHSDVVFDSESNGCHLSSLASPGGEKKIIFNFLQNDVTSRRRRFFADFLSFNESL